MIDRALASGVWMILVGTQQDTSRRAVEVAGMYSEGVYASVGLHPIHTERSHRNSVELGHPAELEEAADRSGIPLKESRGFLPKEFKSRCETFDNDYYRKLAEDPKVLTIGECGLDYYRLSESTKGAQREAFERQIQLSRDVDKPLMIHCRDAFDDLILILKSKSDLLSTRSAGIAHFFTGTKENAKALLDLGFSFTFGGVITFVRDYDEAIKTIPLDRILSETDAPYVTPAPYRGQRNEPSYVTEVVKKLAEIKGVLTGEMMEIIWANANGIFAFNGGRT